MSNKTKPKVNVFHRLMHYAKPYYLLLGICLVIVLASTAIDLFRPYLLKIAIDDSINAIQKPLTKVENFDQLSADDKRKALLLQDHFYLRLEPKEMKDTGLYYQVINYQKTAYLIEGYIGATEIVDFKSEDKQAFIVTKDKEYLATAIGSAEYLAFREEDRVQLSKITLLFFILLFSNGVLNYLQIYLLNIIGQKVIFKLRGDVFSHIQSLSLAFFNNNPVGKLVTRTTNDMTNISDLFTDVLVTLFKDMILILGTIVIMLKIDFKVSLICFSLLPVVFIISIIFRKMARKIYLELKKRVGIINATLNENINGMSVIQIFNRQKAIYDKFYAISKDHYDVSMNELLLFAVTRPTVNILYSITLSLLIWFGGGEVIQGALPFGVLIAFVNYLEQLFNPIFDMTEKFNIIESAMASGERVFDILDIEEKIPNQPQKILDQPLKGKIEFRNVWFSYNEEWILKDVSFLVNPGESVAFVGHTGSGKTTIISLLTRLYDIQKGQILLDDIPIKDYDLTYLRKEIASVLQDVFIFSGDIASNISLADPIISKEKVIASAEYVNASKFIEKLPLKYQEPVTENGSTLSSGQRQLLSFARALAFDPSILILDEATSNIDTETELLIQNAITKVIRNRTTIIIAHRLSTIQHANQIIVLNKGQIKEVGSHESLLAKKGLYYDLYRLQYDESINGKAQ